MATGRVGDGGIFPRPAPRPRPRCGEGFPPRPRPVPQRGRGIFPASGRGPDRVGESPPRCHP